MKIISLGLHLLVLSVIFKILISILEYFKLEKNLKLITLLLFIFSIHPDVVLYVIHINNRTELLMLLFYASSIGVFIFYLQDKVNKYIFIPSFIVFFLLSVLSKQSGLHLPLLLIFLVNILKIAGDKRRVVYKVSGGMIIIMLMLSYLNHTLIEVNPWDTESLLRKPYAMAGTILFTILPMLAERLYLFSLAHKITIGIISLILTITFISSISINKLKLIATVIIFLLIILYPRMFTLGGGRINTHMLFWVLIILLISLSHYNLKFIYPALIGYLFITTIYSFDLIKSNVAYKEIVKEQSFKLKQLEKKTHPKKIFVVLSEMASFVNEHTYLMTGSFCKPELPQQPLVYKFIFPGMQKIKKVISCKRIENELLFESGDRGVYIGDHPSNRINKIYNTYPIGKKDREYYSYKINFHDSVFTKYAVTFFNGQQWELVK